MRTRSRSSQSGSVLANLALGTAAFGSIAAVSIDWTAQQSALALQKQQGYLFATLNDSVGNYMTVLFPKLTEKSGAGTDMIPAECAKLPYRMGTSVATESVILQGKCKLSLPLSTGGVYVVPNAYQPTLTDLKQLGLLDHGISETPALATEPEVAGPDASGAASSAPAPNGYAISIAPMCVGMGSSVTNCQNTNRALTSSVINIQPFVVSTYIQDFTPMMWAAGPDSAMSGPADAENVVVQTDRANPTGEFRSIQSGWTRPNPITRVWSYTTSSGSTSYSRGVDNLVLMRNGYDSAYWQLSRRDGTSPPTANWDFNGKDLTNVGKLTASSAEISGDLEVGGNQVIKGNQSVAGNVDVEGTGTFKGVLTALADLVVKGSTELQGKLTVAGTALFKDNVTLDKNLQVKGTTQLDGALTGTSANFTGALTANALVIGSTQITKDGTLLGSVSGWGVTPGAACSSNLALAQSTDGKLQICRNSGWTPLVTSENIVITAPGSGQNCFPEGAPGRLPDGTLAVCRNGKWESTAQGTATEGEACSVEGSLATSTMRPSPNLVVLGCRGGKWSVDVFSKPRLAYATEGYSCQMDDELALDGRGYPSLLVCKSGTWRPPGTQLLTSMALGTGCTLEGVLASDIQKTGLLVCKNGVWSKTTDPVKLGGSCETLNQALTNSDGSKWYCIHAPTYNGYVWANAPGTLLLWRGDGTRVELNRLVQFKGADYYFYSEPGWINKPQTFFEISYWLRSKSQEEITTYQERSSPISRGDAWVSRMPPLEDNERGRELSRDTCQTYQVTLASSWDLHDVTKAFGGPPAPWRFDLEGGPEVWTATRRDECTNWGCDEPWTGGGGNWWDHVTVDLWNMNIFHRWNTDSRPVILKAKKLFGDSCRDVRP